MESRGKETRTASPPAGESFDVILRQLQGIVERLEGEDLALEESLQAFERGIELSRRGQAILDGAERRVEMLLRDGRTEPLEPGKNE
jgi:exodeoxyribonuclease VII small subunit